MGAETIAALWGAMVGAILTAGISYPLTIYLDRGRIRRDAAARFRAVFAPALAQYDILKGGIEIEAMFKKELPAQAAAIEEFRWFVAPRKQEAYEKAWQDYRPVDESWCYLYWTTDNDKTGEAKTRFRERIHAILAFAE